MDSELFFASSHFCSRRALLARVCCSLVLLCICQPRQSMGRNRKCVLEDSLSEAVWRTILRRPRPPATAWPRGSNQSSAKSPAQKSPSPAPKKGKVSTVGPGAVSLCTTTFAPCQQASRESSSRRSRGDRKASISALGGSSTRSKPLQETLRAAQVRSVWIRASSSWNVPRNGCIARRRSSTERASKKWRSRQRLRGRSEACQAHDRGRNCPDTHCCVPTGFTPCEDSHRRPRNVDGWWSSLFRRHPTHTSNVQDLAGWMSQRNCELRNAIEFGDPVLVAKIGGLVGQGAPLDAISHDDEILPFRTRRRKAPY